MKNILLLCVFALALIAGCISEKNQSEITNDIVNSTVKDSAETNVSGNISTNISNTESSQLKSFDMTVGHTFMTPSTITVNKGDTIKLTVRTATGTETHNHGIAIDAYNINVANTDSANPAVVQFVADQSGEFSVYCKTCWDGPFGKGHPDVRAKLVVK